MELGKVVKTKNMKEWLSPEYLDLETIKKLKKSFPRKKPFPHLELENFLVKEKAEQLLEELEKEEFYLTEDYFYKYMHTKWFSETDNNELLKSFWRFFYSKELIFYINYLTGLDFTSRGVYMRGVLYQDTDFVNIHTDINSEKMTYIYHLTTLEKEDGGVLNLYGVENNIPIKITKKIIPKFNTFSAFKITPISFHNVDEIIGNKQRRVSINGWFI